MLNLCITLAAERKTIFNAAISPPGFGGAPPTIPLAFPPSSQPPQPSFPSLSLSLPFLRLSPLCPRGFSGVGRGRRLAGARRRGRGKGGKNGKRQELSAFYGMPPRGGERGRNGPLRLTYTMRTIAFKGGKKSVSHMKPNGTPFLPIRPRRG